MFIITSKLLLLPVRDKMCLKIDFKQNIALV